MDQSPFRNPNPLAGRVATLIAIAFLAGCASPKADATKAMPATPVSVAVAKEESVPIDVTAVGTVEPSAIIQVRSRVSGELMRVSLVEGSEVHEGDLLFEIDPRPYREALRQAEANVAKDTAQLKQAEANVLRDQALL
jgi:multidrug efflux system membrane fusion protein